MVPQMLPVPLYVMYWSVVALGLPLTVLAMCSLLFLVRNDHVVPIYLINLLISDLVQICCTTFQLAKPQSSLGYVFVLYLVSLMANIGFMVCVSLERYLVIAWPLWYRFKRNIRVSVLVCAAVWLFPVAPALLVTLTSLDKNAVFSVFFLLPFPVLVLSVVGTLKPLYSSVSVSSEEKQRIAGTLLVVLFNYSVFFLPLILSMISLWHTSSVNDVLLLISRVFIRISPLADLGLYVFMGRGAAEKLLAFVCGRRKDVQQPQTVT